MEKGNNLGEIMRAKIVESVLFQNERQKKPDGNITR